MAQPQAFGVSLWGATARRHIGALAAILLVFAAALIAMRFALGQIASAEQDVVRFDRMKHASQDVAAEVREQFIHQAHMLLSLDPAHMVQYEKGIRHTRAASDQLVALTAGAELDVAKQIDTLARDSDRMFRERGLPAIASSNRAVLLELGLQIEAIVDRVVALSDALDDTFEGHSTRAIERAARVRERATLVSTLCFGFAFVLATIVGIWLTRSIVRPVAALWSGARKVGAGDLSARVVVKASGELGQLADTFNQMTEDLKRNQDALVRSQRLAAIGQLAAGVAHEINNPLSVILGYAKLLERRASATTDREELRAIVDEAMQCQRIVQELLDFSRPHQPELSEVDLGELARAAITSLATTDVLANRTVHGPDAGTPVIANVDEGKLRQVVTNLIVNAAQAIPDGGTIGVAASLDGSDALVTVTDDGAGISAQALPRILEPFFTTKRGGTGLGLAIARSITEAHGGRLQIESSATGTRVTMRVPRGGKP